MYMYIHLNVHMKICFTLPICCYFSNQDVLPSFPVTVEFVKSELIAATVSLMIKFKNPSSTVASYNSERVLSVFVLTYEVFGSFFN